MDLDLTKLKQTFFEQKGKEAQADTDERILLAVAEALAPLLDQPATPENMYEAEKLVIPAITKVYLEGAGAFRRFLMGAVSGGGLALMDLWKGDKVALTKDEFHFISLYHITDPAAVEAVKSGQATIGQLFQLQPSIFC